VKDDKIRREICSTATLQDETWLLYIQEMVNLVECLLPD
jgi:hypothetical protein